MLKVYSEHLDSDSLNLLSTLLNQPMYEVSAYQVIIYSKTINSREFLIEISQGWLKINFEWRETPNDLSYFRAHINEIKGSHLFNLAPNANNNQVPGCRILIERLETSIVKNIIIYETDEIWNSERIIYDSHILFELLSGKKILFSIEDTVAEFIEMTMEEETISQMLSEPTVVRRTSLPL